jgi:plasmid stability protein
MASITIRNLDDNLKKRLRMQAAANGRSMEEEVRGMLRIYLEQARAKTAKTKNVSLADAIHKRFLPLGGFEMPFIERWPVREPPDFSDPAYGKE